MRLTPTYGFDDLLSTGIDKVPNFSHVMVENDGSGQTRLYMKVSDVGLTPTSTISDFLNNTTLYCRYEPTRSMVDPTNIDDLNSKYKIGHIWVNESTGDSFVLVDNSVGSAVWNNINSTSADKLDGLDSTQFVRSDVDDIVEGQLTFEKDILIEKSNPAIQLKNVNAGSDNFWLATSGNNVYIATDLNNDDLPDAPNPLTLQNTNNKGYVYGDEIVTYNNLPAKSVSQLEKITEGGHVGWALLGRNSANYGNIGSDAIDLSISSSSSGSKGATGTNSFACNRNTTASGISSYAEGQDTEAIGNRSHAEGYNTTASEIDSHSQGNNTIASAGASFASGRFTEAQGVASSSFGTNTIAKNDSSIATGAYNVGTSTSTILEIGIGTGSSNKKNALEVHTDGRIFAPELTTALINTNRSLVTKEYIDTNVVKKSGDTMTGTLTVPTIDGSNINGGTY